jgi:lysophospholipase L1-like esterase
VVPPSPRSTVAARGRHPLVWLLLGLAGLLLLAAARGRGWHHLFATEGEGDPAAVVVWEGDSQSAPAPQVVTTAAAAVEPLASRVVVRTFATGGAVVDTVAARAQRVDRALARRSGVRNVLVVWIGTNDLGFGADPAAVHEQLRAYAEARRAAGWTVVVGTLLPRAFLTDVPGYEARRQAFNDLVRSQWEGYADGLADVAADEQLGRPGAQDDRTWFLADRTHLNDAGRRVAAAVFTETLRGVGLA